MATIRGVTYPLSFDNGDLVVAEDRSLIHAHILHILETIPSERIMRQNFGISEQIFKVLVPVSVNTDIKNAIEREIGDEISDIFVSSEEYNENGFYRLKVEYSVDSVPQPPVFYKLGE